MIGSHNERIKTVESLWGKIDFGLRLIWSYLRLAVLFFRTGDCHVVIVGHPGYFHVHFARLLCACKRKKPRLVLDLFIPLYNMLVEDRRIFAPGDTFSRLLHVFEASACKQADLNLLDTHEHCCYIEREFAIPVECLVATYVGSSLSSGTRLPAKWSEGIFKVVFVGTCIPLQGVETILSAANLLSDSDIRFSIVGCDKLMHTQDGMKWRDRLDNVDFIDWVETDALPVFMQAHQLALGIFGATEKSARVIPTKVFDICNMGMPFITADTPAITRGIC